MATKGTNESFIFHWVNSQKVNKPSNGPYVYPATVKTAVITLSLFIILNITMIKKIKIEKPICTINRFCLRFCSGSFSKFKKSTQKAVVRDVKAESALEKAAAIIPSRKTIPT